MNKLYMREQLLRRKFYTVSYVKLQGDDFICWSFDVPPTVDIIWIVHSQSESLGVDEAASLIEYKWRASMTCLVRQNSLRGY